jgi:16S rRNA (cytosine1402-N4)-methyltransferase
VAEDEEFGSEQVPQGTRHGTSEFGHVSVLSKEAIDFFRIRRGGTYVDATLGAGGHGYEIARHLGPAGHLIGLDKDPHALEIARQRLANPPVALKSDWPRITLLHTSFRDARKLIPPDSVDGLLADLGLSSLQLGDPARGFSFQAEGPLDMRMDPHSALTADQVVNHMDEEELAHVIYEFGEERRSRRIARAIVRARPITTTAHLVRVLSTALRPMKNERIHPATRTFQAIRIFVNREIEDLEALMESAPQLLRKGGRLVVISFHSLEDRVVKDALRAGAKTGVYRVLTKKPVTAQAEEIERNPRSRSAKLRAGEKI